MLGTSLAGEAAKLLERTGTAVVLGLAFDLPERTRLSYATDSVGLEGVGRRVTKSCHDLLAS